MMIAASGARASRKLNMIRVVASRSTARRRPSRAKLAVVMTIRKSSAAMTTVWAGPWADVAATMSRLSPMPTTSAARGAQRGSTRPARPKGSSGAPELVRSGVMVAMGQRSVNSRRRAMISRAAMLTSRVITNRTMPEAIRALIPTEPAKPYCSAMLAAKVLPPGARMWPEML